MVAPITYAIAWFVPCNATEVLVEVELRYLVLVSLYLLVSSAFATTGDDAPPSPAPKFDLGQTTKTAICQLILSTWKPNRNLPQAIEDLRAFRLATLKEAEVKPSFAKRMFVSGTASARQRREVARQIRGIELWHLKTREDQAGRPRLLGFTLEGEDAIRTYYGRLAELRDELQGLLSPSQKLLLETHATAAHQSMKVGGGATGLALVPLSFGFVHAVPMLVMAPFAVRGFYQSHHFRFKADRVQTDFEKDVLAALDSSEPGPAWVYASRTYSVLRNMIDAAWAKDSQSIRANLLSQNLLPVFAGIQRIIALYARLFKQDELAGTMRALEEGLVMVDQLFTRGVDDVPRITITVRTTTHSPYRQIQPRESTSSAQTPAFRVFAPASE